MLDREYIDHVYRVSMFAVFEQVRILNGQDLLWWNPWRQEKCQLTNKLLW